MATLTTSWKSYASASYSTGVATITFYLEAKYSSQSVANNTTAVQTRLRSAFTKGNSLAGAGYKFTCTYCSTVSGSGNWNFANEVITSGSATVTHNNDGTKTLSLSATAYNKYWNFTKNLSASVSLPTIARKATVTAAEDFNDEGNPKITFTNPAGFQVNPYLGFYDNDNTLLLAIERSAGTYSSPYTFTMTTAERNQIRNILSNKTSCKVSEGVGTWVSGTNIGASSLMKTFTIVNANPTFNAAYLDTNSTTTAITGNNQLIIRNKSTLQINVTGASAKKGASLTNIKCVINGVTYTATLSGGNATFNIGTLNVSSNTTATITLTDTRGLTAVKTLNLQVVNWQLPTAIITMTRANNYYSTTTINVNADYSSLNNQNTITIQMRYKKTTESSYSAYQTLQDNVSSQFEFDNNYQWNIQVVLTDRLGTTTYNLLLDRGVPIAYFDRLHNSLGVNCIPTLQGSLETSGKIKAGSYTRNTTDTWMPVVGSGGVLDYTQRKFSTSKTHTDFNNNQDFVATLSFLSYWNGAYNSGGSSNLTYAHQGTIQCKPVTLWTNPNVSAQFGAQTINISNLSTYAFIDIIFYLYYPGSTQHMGVERHYYDASRNSGQITKPFRYGSTMYIGNRDFTVNSGSIEFKDSRNNNNTNDNNWYKPYKIIGYK